MNAEDRDYSHLKENFISNERVFDGKVIKVDHSEVELPNGERARREIVYHKGAVCLIAVHGDEMFFVRQYRIAPDEFLLEIPAGKIEVGEAPAETARKELKEEIGGVAGDIRKLQEFYVSPGFSNEKVFLYEALDVEIEAQSLEPDEFLDIVPIRLESLRENLEAGRFGDAKTIIAVQHVIEKYNL